MVLFLVLKYIRQVFHWPQVDCVHFLTLFDKQKCFPGVGLVKDPCRYPLKETPPLQHTCFIQEVGREKYAPPHTHTYSMCNLPAVKPNTRCGVTDTGGSENLALPLNFLLNSGWTLLVWMGDTRQSLSAPERWSVMSTSRLTEQLAVPVPLSCLR